MSGLDDLRGMWQPLPFNIVERSGQRCKQAGPWEELCKKQWISTLQQRLSERLSGSDPWHPDFRVFQLRILR